MLREGWWAKRGCESRGSSFAIYHPLDQWISLRRTSPSSSPSSLPRMTNNKHRHFSLSNGVFTDKKFTRLPPFARGNWPPRFLLFSATGRLPPDPTHPPTTPSRFLGDTYTPTPLVCYDVSSRVARWRCARPFKRTVISEGEEEGDGFPPLPPPRLARLRHDFSDASRVGGGLRTVSSFFSSSFVKRWTERDEFIGCISFFRVFRLLSINNKVIS